MSRQDRTRKQRRDNRRPGESGVWDAVAPVRPSSGAGARSLPPPVALVGADVREGRRSTVAAANTVVNQYAVLAANAAAGATSITVTNIADLPSLTAGDLVMIYQAQGATIDSTDTANYETVTALNNAGRYELVGVTGIAANTLTLESTCGGLRYSYTVAGKVQVIRVPQYTTLTVNAAPPSRPPPGTA